ncbi:MAG: hypothetical protein H0V92_03840 [Pseudonocardiales bacterium]|nr:hypothetical protein [Pseudonocardiales bacterium]
MAVKVVTGMDGRIWTVRRKMMLRMPPTGEEFEFEHDLEGGRIGMTVILAMLVLFVVALLSWWSSAIPIPGYVKWVFVIGALFFPVRWVLRLPWRLVAETPGTYDPDRKEEKDREHWVGTVRGAAKARDECALLINTIKKRGRLAKADGLMRKN